MFKKFAFGSALVALLIAVGVISPSASLSTALADEGYKLPWTAGEAHHVTQGWNSALSHHGMEAFAYDFDLADNTPVRAAKAGIVKFVKTPQVSADTCGGSNMANQGNYVTIYHGDGDATLYLHLSKIVVSPETPVAQGAVIGYSGHTGYTKPVGATQCGPHLHFQRQAQGAWFTQSKAVRFDEYPGQQLQVGPKYVSQNVDTSATRPTAPSNLTAAALSTSSIRFGWQDNSSNETQFLVYRWSGSTWQQIAARPANTTSFDDTGLQPASYYYYTVCATNAAGSSCAGSFATGRTSTQLQPPSAPSGLSATALSPSSIRFNWAYSGATVDHFRVFRWSGSAWQVIGTPGAGTTSYTDSGLRSSTTYYYTVCADNSAGSACASGYTSAQTQSSNNSQRSEVVVDERSGDFSRSGRYWWDSSIGQGGHSFWTYANGSSVDSSGVWSANLAGGQYEVFAFIPRDNATTRNARYEISHSGGTAVTSVNQNDLFDAWASLGTFNFASGYAQRVRLTDATGEAPNSYRKVNFDAIRFVPR